MQAGSMSVRECSDERTAEDIKCNS
jgi:hypothetical protein